MPSPTFNLLFRYPTRSGRRLVHLDLYRLGEEDEVWELGWSELGADDELVVIEWAERAAGLLPESHWTVELSVPPDEPSLRDVEVRRTGTPPPLPRLPVPVPEEGA